MEKRLSTQPPCNTYFDVFNDYGNRYCEYNPLSPHELQNTLIKFASKKSKNIINASGDNSDFLATVPRQALSLLSQISNKLAEQESSSKEFGFTPLQTGIYKKFYEQFNKSKRYPGFNFLQEALDKMKRLNTCLTKDEFIHDLVNATLGCSTTTLLNSRIQSFAEPILTEFLDKIVYRPRYSLKNKIKILPTEDSSAAIVYILNSLKYNKLIFPNDTVAIVTPIPPQYLEITKIKNYPLNQVYLESENAEYWNLPNEEIDKLKNPLVKLLLIVNPSNPTGTSLTSQAARYIKSVVKNHNKNLIIISDNAYAPFVDDFYSLMDVLPLNTISIFSFSNYFGASSSRLACVFMRNTNIIDRDLLKVDDSVNDRYNMITKQSQTIKFIDRMLIDSRQVVNQTSVGLSTQQQTLMCLFSMYSMSKNHCSYHCKVKKLLSERLDTLLEPLSYNLPIDSINSNYFVVLNLIHVVNNLVGGSDFGNYLKYQRDPLEFLTLLAKKYSTVLAPAIAFGGTYWGFRVSLASTYIEDYEEIGENLRDLIDKYYDDFQKYKTQNIIE